MSRMVNSFVTFLNDIETYIEIQTIPQGKSKTNKG